MMLFIPPHMYKRLVSALLTILISSLLFIVVPSSFAACGDAGSDPCPTDSNTNNTSFTKDAIDPQTGFSKELLKRAEEIRTQKVDLSAIPGPETGSFRGVLNAVIRLAVYMAGSVMLFLIVTSSFMLITGKKEAYEQFRVRIVSVFIGALLVFGSFIIVSAIWGIAWWN